MKSYFVLIVALIFSLPARGQVISDDGHEISPVDNTPGGIVTITDDVPLPSTPDYSCNLRMQVGGLDFGDFDNDGDLDLAVGCYHSQSYPPYNDWRNFVLTNNEGQLESVPSWWSSDSRSTTDIKWADFNGDGYLDLFCGNGDFTLDPNVIYFGSANGLANTPGWLATDQTWTTGVSPADFDNDGDIDMATSNQGVNPNYNRPVYIYYNNGSGLNAIPDWESSDQMLSSFVSWGDMDQDGFLDLAVSKWVNFQSCVYLNNDGVMGVSPVWTTGSTRGDKGIGWGDVDGDTFPELAIGASDPTWLFDNVDGVLGNSPIWQSHNSYHGCQDLGWGDIDGDGDPDLATVEFSAGLLRLYLDVGGTLDSIPTWVYDGSGVGTALAFGDVNGDGRLDLAMGLSGQPSVLLFLNTGGSSSIDEKPIAPGAFSLSQNYPNPFNSGTRIAFSLSRQMHAKLEVFDVVGRKIATLADGEFAEGYHSLEWVADVISSGPYYCRLSAGGNSKTMRMIILK